MSQSRLKLWYLDPSPPIDPTHCILWLKTPPADCLLQPHFCLLCHLQWNPDILSEQDSHIFLAALRGKQYAAARSSLSPPTANVPRPSSNTQSEKSTGGTLAEASRCCWTGVNRDGDASKEIRILLTCRKYTLCYSEAVGLSAHFKSGCFKLIDLYIPTNNFRNRTLKFKENL